jgi:FkbM family methyltransferase
LLKGQKPVQAQEALRFEELVKLKLVRPDFGIAIDGGAHVGSWTQKMAQVFHTVYAFEPCPSTFIELCENIINEGFGDCDVIPMQKALMDNECLVNVISPRNRTTSTAKQVRVSSQGRIEAISIDSLKLAGCDFIKLDLEGCEALALKGARKTIKKYKPFIVAEFNDSVQGAGGSNSIDAKRLLKSWGYREVWRRDVDRGFKWMG